MCAADEEDTECKDQLLSPDFQQYFLNVYLVSNISLSQEQLLIYFKPNHCQDHAAIEQQNTNSLLYNFTLQNQYLRVKRSQFQEFFLFNDLSIKSYGQNSQEIIDNLKAESKDPITKMLPRYCEQDASWIENMEELTEMMQNLKLIIVQQSVPSTDGQKYQYLQTFVSHQNDCLFLDLFNLKNKEIVTVSVGAARPNPPNGRRESYMSQLAIIGIRDLVEYWQFILRNFKYLLLNMCLGIIVFALILQIKQNNFDPKLVYSIPLQIYNRLFRFLLLVGLLFAVNFRIRQILFQNPFYQLQLEPSYNFLALDVLVT